MVQHIEINGDKIPLLFGMHLVEALITSFSKTKPSQIKASVDIIYYAHENWTIKTDEDLKISRDQVYDWVEQNWYDEKVKKAISDVVEGYNKSRVNEDVKSKVTEAKKKLSGKK